MADRVQYVMDRMAPALREMQQVGLFSAEEVKSVVKKRTDFEYRLRRRQQTTADYYGYLKYELGLEELRALRCRKQGKSQGDGKEGEGLSKEMLNRHRKLQSTFMRHISYVFERALRRFPDDMGLWSDYISFLQEKKAYSTLNTVFGRALCLHPKNEALWLQAAVFEINVNSNAHAARVLLQRALRLNKQSKKLWQTYFELELWHVARGIERRRLLGLNADPIPADDEEELEDELGIPWVVYRHATKNILDLTFAMSLLKATGAGCAVTNGRSEFIDGSNTLQKEIQADIFSRFSVSLNYWSSMVKMSAAEHLSSLKHRQKSRNSLWKANEKQTVSATGGKGDSRKELYRDNSVSLLMDKLRMISAGVGECLSLLKSCKDTMNRNELSPSFLAACWCRMFAMLSPVLSVPANVDVNLSDLDLFRSQAHMNSSNIVEILFEELNESSKFLKEYVIEVTARDDDPYVLAAQLNIAYTQALLGKQYPSALGSEIVKSVDSLKDVLDNVMQWLSDNSTEQNSINVWSIIADKVFHTLSVIGLFSGNHDTQLQKLCTLVMSRGNLLVNVALNCHSVTLSTEIDNLLLPGSCISELKSRLFVEAIEKTMLRNVEETLLCAEVNTAMETALLGRMPTTVPENSLMSSADCIYVDWLIRYTELALLHEGEAGWQRACEFVETRCFTERPHSITSSLSLESYYQRVVEQGMTLLRPYYVLNQKVDNHNLASFVLKLIDGAMLRCQCHDKTILDKNSGGLFLEVKEEIQRLSGQFDEANHTRWKRARMFY